MRRRCQQRGFTLLEVLIAAVLMGSVFVAVVSLMSQSLRNIERIQPHQQAMLHAREIMSQQLLLDELQPSRSAGQFADGYRWQVDVEPDEAPIAALVAAQSPTVAGEPASAPPKPLPGQPALFKIQVQIAWGDPHHPRTYAVETTQWVRWALPKQP